MWRELDDFVTMVFNQRATAKLLARRLYVYFVAKEITNSVEQEILEPLTDIIFENDYELKPALRVLLKSEHFLELTKRIRTILLAG